MTVLPLVVITAALTLLVGRRAASADRSGLASRFAPVFAGIAVAGLLAMVLAGGDAADSGGGGLFIPLAVFATVLLCAAVVVRATRPRRVAERPWSSPRGVPPEAAAGTRASAPDLGSPSTSGRDIGRGHTSGSSSWSVARALGRVESRELAMSPLFGVGIGFCLLTFLLFVVLWGPENSVSWAEFVQYAPWFAHPLVGMTVVASHRAVTRAGRDGTAELFDTCPADQSTRTNGFLLTAIVPVTALTVFLAAMIIGTAWRSPYVHGGLDAESIGDLLGAVVLGAGGVALGVALGRWVRFGLAPIVAVVAVGFLATGLNGVGGGDWNPLRYLSTVPTIEGPSPVYTDRPIIWHVVWIAALTGLAVAAALARHRRDRSVGGIAMVAIVLAVVAGIGVTRPMASSSADLIASYIAEPEDHQDCLAIDERVNVCTFELHREFQAVSVDRLAPIAAALPDAARSITLRQIYSSYSTERSELADLPPEVRRLLTEDDLDRPAGEVAFPFELTEAPLDHGLDLALGAVGLPTAADDDLLPYAAAGQARGVVALWLASRGLDAKDAARLTRAGSEDPIGGFDRASIYEGGACNVPAVVWSAQDLAAARAVRDLPEAVVASVLNEEWERWLDPSTTTDELLAALGLPGVGLPEWFVLERGEPC